MLFYILYTILMSLENFHNELNVQDSQEENYTDWLLLEEKISTNMELVDLQDELQDSNQIDKKEKPKPLTKQLDEFFTKNNLYKEWWRKEDSERNRKYNARSSFVQYLHYLGIKLFKTSKYLTTEEEWNKIWKDLVKFCKKEWHKDADKYKNWLTAYAWDWYQNKILLDFIQKNANKSVINWVKLPQGKILSQLTKPIERK